MELVQAELGERPAAAERRLHVAHGRLHDPAERRRLLLAETVEQLRQHARPRREHAVRGLDAADAVRAPVVDLDAVRAGPDRDHGAARPELDALLLERRGRPPRDGREAVVEPHHGLVEPRVAARGGHLDAAEARQPGAERVERRHAAGRRPERADRAAREKAGDLRIDAPVVPQELGVRRPRQVLRPRGRITVGQGHTIGLPERGQRRPLLRCVREPRDHLGSGGGLGGRRIARRQGAGHDPLTAEGGAVEVGRRPAHRPRRRLRRSKVDAERRQEPGVDRARPAARPVEGRRATERDQSPTVDLELDAPRHAADVLRRVEHDHATRIAEPAPVEVRGGEAAQPGAHHYQVGLVAGGGRSHVRAAACREAAGDVGGRLLEHGDGDRSPGIRLHRGDPTTSTALEVKAAPARRAP